MNRSHQITRARMSALAAAALAGALVLSGCNGTTDPQPSPTTTAPTTVDTPTEEPTTTETATETEEPTSDSALPEAAQEQTEAGAIAFIEYFFDEVNRATMEVDTSIIPTLSSAECVACENLQGIVEGLEQDGQRAAEPVFSIGDFELIEEREDGVMIFSSTLTAAAVDILNDDGTTATTLAPNEGGRTVGVTWRDGEWQLLDAEVS